MATTEKRWLTKDQKQVLKPHAEHFMAMARFISEATAEDLEALNGASRACTTINCGWHEYAAAQYLMKEIAAEMGWRSRRDAAAAELLEPIAHIHDRMTDDGAPVPTGERA